jgi:NADH dehydrogenase (ubiquinone) 1 alpha subcomplex subunit 2
MKKNNPSTPIMLREAAGTVPKIYARYGRSCLPNAKECSVLIHAAEFGQEKSQSLEGRRMLARSLTQSHVLMLSGVGLSDKQIEETVTTLVKDSA